MVFGTVGASCESCMQIDNRPIFKDPKSFFFLGIIIAFGGITRIGLHACILEIPLIILTRLISAKPFCIMSHLGPPPPRVAKSAVIGQHNLKTLRVAGRRDFCTSASDDTPSRRQRLSANDRFHTLRAGLMAGVSSVAVTTPPWRRLVIFLA